MTHIPRIQNPIFFSIQVDPTPSAYNSQTRNSRSSPFVHPSQSQYLPRANKSSHHEFNLQIMDCCGDRWDSGSTARPGILQVEPRAQIAPPTRQEQCRVLFPDQESVLVLSCLCYFWENQRTESEAVWRVLEESHVLELLGTLLILLESVVIMTAEMKLSSLCILFTQFFSSP